MTYTEEFIPTEEGQDFNEASPYPNAFGITFTPMVGGVIFGVLGLVGASYLLMNQVLPTWNKYQDLQSKVTEKQNQVQQKQANQKKLTVAQEKLEAAKQQNKDVLALFATEQTIDTLMLDLNRFIVARQGQLLKFDPDTPQAAASSTTPKTGLDAKLKRKNVNVAIEGSFDQIQSILRSVERLQSLLLIKDFRAELGGKEPQKFAVDQQGKAVTVGQPIVKTTFKLQMVLPLTPQEAAAATQPVKK
jgi:type IV pilus assembly protein PilO